MDILANYAATQEYLFGLKAGGVRYGIDRMNSWLGAIGHPEAAFPCIHITGTNGKGSTAAMLESIFRQAGWRTGLYTSPHLVRLGERVQVDRQPLTEAEIMAFARELKPIAEAVSRDAPEDQPSFFEFMTAMAFLQFARKACDIGLIEVGLGGRLDATNVVTPEIAVITSVGLDHTELLGDTIEKIAFEKAGIIKPGRPVVVGHVSPSAEKVIREIAAQRGSRVRTIAEEFGADLAGYPRSGLEGDYQRWNAATATLVARSMPERWNLSEAVIARGLAAVQWPGRWQRTMIGGRHVVLDSSHNPEGAAVLEGQLASLVGQTGRKPIVVAGALGAARARALIDVICRQAREIYFVRPEQARACSFEELEALVPRSFEGPVRRARVEELFPAKDVCAIGAEGDVVVVTGSIYLLGEVLTRLEPERGDGEGRLQDF
jgi:dihydrofolate synthase/folylpolyglutamate synthase